MGYFMPDPDPRRGYFASADLAGLKLDDLSRLMPFGVPLETIGSMPATNDGGDLVVAGGLPCEGPYCQSGGSRGMTGIYDIDGKVRCWDCAGKLPELEGLSGAEKAEALAPYLIGGGGSGMGGGANVGGNPNSKVDAYNSATDSLVKGPAGISPGKLCQAYDPNVLRACEAFKYQLRT